MLVAKQETAKMILSSALVLVATLNVYQCDIVYHPVQVLIPINTTTNSGRNNTTNLIPPAYNSGYYYGYKNGYYNNRTFYPFRFQNNSYNNGSQDGHLLIGVITAYDRLLFEQTYYKPSRWYTYREKIIEYPKDLPSGYLRHDTISAVRIYNQYHDGNTARAAILSGGIGRQYVKIRLASRYSKGFRYIVQIWGR